MVCATSVHETFHEREAIRLDEASTPAAGRVVLALEDVSKSFGAVAALRDARLELRAGEAHALVGENGAGKSTLRSEEHTSELQSRQYLVCRLLLEKKKITML